MQKVLTDSTLIPSTIYFKFYLFRALQKVGLGDKYLELLQPWKNMIDNGMTTFGETDINPRSECHAWSASPCFDFLHTVAGIYPAVPGFKSVIIEPNFGYLNNINVEMPHPEGIIKIKIQKEKQNEIYGEITLPNNTDGNFIWNNSKIKLHPGKQSLNIK
jgi:hypothetical protein